MRNLLINLAFIFTLIIGFSSDAFSQKGNGNLVDIFGLAFSTEPAENSNGIGTSYNIYNTLAIRISEGKDSPALAELEFGHNTLSSISIQVPANINNQFDGKYYVEVWMNGVFLGGKYKYDF